MRISLSRLATVTLIVLVWSIPAYCSEIHDAVAAGDLAKVKALLKDNPDLISSRNNAGQTPLHLATEYGYRDIVELLLANKADVNAIVLAMMDTMAGKSFLWLKVGCTPLHIAAGNGRKDVAKLLLANGANVSANCQGVIRGMTPLHQLLRQHGGHE
jgi:ankyrin repeat protein